MHDFFCTDPKDMYYKILADRSGYFKKSEKGVRTMCQMMQELGDIRYNEGWTGGLAEGWAGGKAEGMLDGERKKAKETAVALSEKGWTADQISEIIKYDSKEIEEWLRKDKASLS